MKTTIKKALNITAAIILCGGLVQSLHRAANDYGLREAENVHPAVTAQLNDTSGKGTDGGTTNGKTTIEVNMVLMETEYYERVKTDGNGNAIIDKHTYTGLRPNTTYTFLIRKRECTLSRDCICISDQAGIISISYTKGWDSTNGDCTNNG